MCVCILIKAANTYEKLTESNFIYFYFFYFCAIWGRRYKEKKQNQNAPKQQQQPPPNSGKMKQEQGCAFEERVLKSVV